VISEAMAMLTIGGGSEAVRDFVSAVIATYVAEVFPCACPGLRCHLIAHLLVWVWVHREDVQSMYTFVADDFNGRMSVHPQHFCVTCLC